MPIQIFGTFLPSIAKLTSSEMIDIYIDTTEYHPNSNCKVWFQSEPMIIHQNMNHINFIAYLQQNFSKYDFIFCYDPQAVGVPNAFPKLAAGTWIPKEFFSMLDTSLKQFKISNLTGFKSLSNGHIYRHQLYLHQELFKQFPITFFRSSAPPIIQEILSNPLIPKDLSAKTILFDTFQYSIVIENTREKNCFSEKIIDCLITKTIPIYYGCENISEYFDTTGWIILDDTDFLQTLFTQLQNLNHTYYQDHIAIIQKNYQKAIELSDISVNYYNCLSKYLPITLSDS